MLAGPQPTRNDGEKRSRSTLAARVTLAAILLSVACCGPRLVDPGRAPIRLSPLSDATSPVLPVDPASATSGLPTTESMDLQQMPTESLLTLPRETENAKYHTVQAGESFAGIARKYNLSVERLRSANGLDAAAAIKPQQMLFIPGSR